MYLSKGEASQHYGRDSHRDINRVWKLVFLVSALVGLQFWLSPPLQAATLPPGFVDSLVREVVRPTDVTWTPDGRMILLQQTGVVTIRTTTGQSVTALQ